MRAARKLSRNRPNERMLGPNGFSTRKHASVRRAGAAPNGSSALGTRVANGGTSRHDSGSGLK